MIGTTHKMSKRYVIVTALASLVLAASCSSSASDERSSTTSTTANTNVNSNTVPLATGEQVAPPQPADVNAESASTASSDTLPGVANRLDRKPFRAGEGGTVDAEALAMKYAKPAPENSTFASYLSDVGHEIRTFRSHPQILKVEKRIGGNEQSLKIYLRGGRVIERPGNLIPILATASTAEILSVAGLSPASPKAPASDAKTGAKQPGE